MSCVCSCCRQLSREALPKVPDARRGKAQRRLKRKGFHWSRVPITPPCLRHASLSLDPTRHFGICHLVKVQRFATVSGPFVHSFRILEGSSELRFPTYCSIFRWKSTLPILSSLCITQDGQNIKRRSTCKCPAQHYLTSPHQL